ncbi:hypothetical protein [uncultured Varibaculum sp.]|uniref:hypothetical protein n=1 Tax=uncultured Varibaculum sp. TaxID=413896 RepID=UPI002803F517|nr:hypothetical protein [uncultured Varibaculum sp.]
MANLDEIAMRSVRKLADLLGSHDRRLARLETAQDARRTSLDDGEVIELRGQSGKVVGTFGKNPDGTYATVPFDGPMPRAIEFGSEWHAVSETPGTITLTFTPQEPLPADFAGVDFYYSPGGTRMLLGAITSAAGGSKTVSAKPGSYLVQACMRTVPGKVSLDDGGGAFVNVAAPVDVKDFDNAKAKLSTAQSQIDALLAAPPSAGVSVSATPPSDPKDGDMWLHPVTDDMGNTVHVLQVFQAGAWVTVEDQDAKQIAAGAKASADAAIQTANLAKSTAEQAATGAVDVTRLAADSNSTVKESVVGKLWDVIRAKLVAAKQIITEDMLATGSVTASKITASEELSAKAAKFLRITADQIEAGTLNAKVKIGSEGSITVGDNDIVMDRNNLVIGNIKTGESKKQINLDPSYGMTLTVTGEKVHGSLSDYLYLSEESSFIRFKGLDSEGNVYDMASITADANNETFDQASDQVYRYHEYPIRISTHFTSDGLKDQYRTSLKLGDGSINVTRDNKSSNRDWYTRHEIIRADYASPLIGAALEGATSVIGSNGSIPPRLLEKTVYNNNVVSPTVIYFSTEEPEGLRYRDIWIEPPRVTSDTLSAIEGAGWEVIEPLEIGVWRDNAKDETQSNAYGKIKGKIKRINSPFSNDKEFVPAFVASTFKPVKVKTTEQWVYGGFTDFTGLYLCPGYVNNNFALRFRCADSALPIPIGHEFTLNHTVYLSVND